MINNIFNQIKYSSSFNWHFIAYQHGVNNKVRLLSNNSHW